MTFCVSLLGDFRFGRGSSRSCCCLTRAAFPDVVYVLDVFMNKSKMGNTTPQADKDRVRQRFKVAKQHYDDTHGKRGA